MKLYWKEKNKVMADVGFEFWMKNPFQLIYSEGENKITIPGEMLTGETELLVSMSTIKKWDPPYSSVVDGEKQKQIIENVRLALDFMKIRYEEN